MSWILHPCVYTGIDIRWCRCRHCVRQRDEQERPRGRVQAWALAAALTCTGCASTQRVAQCTIEQRQGLADPLADLVWGEVRSGRYVPSRYARETVIEFARDYGVAAVRCALQELLREWAALGTGRETRHAVAESIARDLMEEL